MYRFIIFCLFLLSCKSTTITNQQTNASCGSKEYVCMIYQQNCFNGKKDCDESKMYLTCNPILNNNYTSLVWENKTVNIGDTNVSIMCQVPK